MYYYSNNLQVLNIDEQKWMLATVGQVHRWLVQRKEIQHMVISFSETEPLASAFQFQRCTKNGQIYCLGSLIGIKLDVWIGLKYRAIYFQESMAAMTGDSSTPATAAYYSRTCHGQEQVEAVRPSSGRMVPASARIEETSQRSAPQRRHTACLCQVTRLPHWTVDTGQSEWQTIRSTE